MVVDVDEGVELGLELGDGGWGGLFAEPFLECLLESFDFSAGGWLVWSGVFLFDPEAHQEGFVNRPGFCAGSSALKDDDCYACRYGTQADPSAVHR